MGRGNSSEMYLEDNLGKKGVGGSSRKSATAGGIGSLFSVREDQCRLGTH